jgi:3-oxoacyl-[acyl-carrier-protein] synthase-1/3-oxoacyl-[acyl-carrier-protein] synthase II
MGAAILARGAASALGLGTAAFDVGALGQAAPSAWSTRASGQPFGRVTACAAARADRPRALFELALQQLLEELSQRDPDWRDRRLGMVVGTSSGGLAALERSMPVRADDAGSRRCAYFAPLCGAEQLLGRRPERSVALYAACASSALALGLALRWLELGRFELVIAGGYDAESDWVNAGFDSLKATSAAAPRPFRSERDGMALGEGAALVALVQRASRAYGFLQGFAATTDAVHITAPDRTGSALARAIDRALADAGSSVSEIDFVSVHGTGTPYNDAAEAAALGHAFGPALRGLPLHAFKPSIGHTLGAASALEALAALSALERGVCPASVSPGTPMPDLPARLLDRNEAAPVKCCLKLATAFGGANAALVLSTNEPTARTITPRSVHVVACGEAVFQLDVQRFASQLVVPTEKLPRSDLLAALAIAAAGEALAAAVRAGQSLNRLRTGVVVGSVGATLEADAQFAERVLSRGPEHAEPRRFPATSPNACAGHVAIAFGLGGPSHAVGSGGAAALEAAQVACDWIAAGDVDAMLVIAAEQVGPTSRAVLAALGLPAAQQGALALVLSAAPVGPPLSEALIERVSETHPGPENHGFRGLEALCRAAGLPESEGFGSVRAPE